MSRPFCSNRRRSLTTDLAEFLRRAAARQFARGRHDCGLWLADWATRRCGFDPAAALRGRYASDAESAALMPDGLRETVAMLARAAGMKNASTAKPGDIAVIRILNGEPTGAIRVARGWMVLAERRGVSCVPDRAVTVLGCWAF